jgi:mRNA-degrading endonuclease toxin of MazEF toxin-antitoxin module
LKAGLIYCRCGDRDAGDRKCRGIVVVSPEYRNDLLEDVLVVPLTGFQRSLPTRIELQPTAENGLEVVSYAQCERVTNILKKRLRPEPMGRVSLSQLEAIRRACVLSLGLEDLVM